LMVAARELAIAITPGHVSLVHGPTVDTWRYRYGPEEYDSVLDRYVSPYTPKSRYTQPCRLECRLPGAPMEEWLRHYSADVHWDAGAPPEMVPGKALTLYRGEAKWTYKFRLQQLWELVDKPPTSISLLPEQERAGFLEKYQEALKAAIRRLEQESRVLMRDKIRERLRLIQRDEATVQ